MSYRLNEQSSLLVGVGVALLADDCLASGVEAEVRLSHKLLIERGVDSVVEVLAYHLDIAITPVSDVGGTGATSFEKFRQDGFFLLIHMAVTLSTNTETLSLDRVIELSLTLLGGRVLRPMITVLPSIVSRRVACLHRLGILLRCIGQRE